jgi:hypothetical protein
MIDDDEVAVAGERLRVRYQALVHRPDRLPLGHRDFDAVAGDRGAEPAERLAPESSGHDPGRRPGERAAERTQRKRRGDGGAVTQLRDRALQALLR